MTDSDSRAPGDDSEAPIEIVGYDTSWPALFAAERAVLDERLQPWLVGAIEHIGSTAVPGLPAKPIIDLMAPVESLVAAQPAIAAAAGAGYVYFPYKADVMHWFCKPSPQLRTHHLHLVPCGSALWEQRLRFRDALRADPALAAEYAALKLDLARRFRQDREAYTAAKTPFVERVLSLARREGPEER